MDNHDGLAAKRADGIVTEQGGDTDRKRELGKSPSPTITNGQNLS